MAPPRRLSGPVRAAALIAVAVAVIVAMVMAIGHRQPGPHRGARPPGARVAPTWRTPVTPVVSLSSRRQLPVVLEDDQLSLFSTGRERRQFMATLRWLGVGILRISSDWSVQAPDGDSPRKPRGFDGADPNDYSPARMRNLDDAVRAAAAAGIAVDIDVGFYAPLWATRSTRDPHSGGANPYRRYVSAVQFAAYARMLATRYDGRFTPNGQSSPLPKVSLFEIWNEPNLSWDFEPQRVAGRAVSPDLYRRMVQLGYPAIKRADPAATVLIGNTSSTGTSGIPPLRFIEQLACVDARLRPLRTGACRDFRELPGDGWAHHPYEYGQEPWTGSADPDDAQIGDLPRLQRLLDRLVAMGRLAPAVRRLWLTEQGYQSNGQIADISRWDEAQQAQFLAISEYEAWASAGTAAFSQFLLRDTQVRQTLRARAASGNGSQLLGGTWTTGLERQDGTRKPALWMLRTPVVARILPTAGAGCVALQVWGRLQPDTRGRLTAAVQFGSGPGAYRTVTTLATGPDGVLDAVLRFGGGLPARVRLAFGDGKQPILTPAAIPRRLGSQPLPPGIPAKVSCPRSGRAAP